MKKIIVEYTSPEEGEYNEIRYAILDIKSESKEDILEALKNYGLSWEIKDKDCYIHIISKTIQGKELIK